VRAPWLQLLQGRAMGGVGWCRWVGWWVDSQLPVSLTPTLTLTLPHPDLTKNLTLTLTLTSPTHPI